MTLGYYALDDLGEMKYGFILMFVMRHRKANAKNTNIASL